MDRRRQELLLRIMALEFTLIDLNLFLDTHPESDEALAHYHKVRDELVELKERYSREYYPLTPDQVYARDRWNWIDDPWPWEEAFTVRWR